MNVKRTLTAATAIAALLLTQTPVFAVDLDYSGPVNSFTGEPTGMPDTTQNQDHIPVADGIYYDRATRKYIYNLGGSAGAAISANIMDGMIVTDAVSIQVDRNLETELYRDGTLVEAVDLEELRDPGRYVLKARIAGNQPVRVMSFTVVGAATGLINSYPMPTGFIVTDATLTVTDETGAQAPAAVQWDRSKVSMSENGTYRVQYQCARTGMNYTLQTTIDHTPPTLKLADVVNGLAKGPVDISDLEPGCRIGITLNGGKMSYRDELTLSGDYAIILMDPAGNLTNYSFTILPYLDANSWIFFGLVLAVVTGVAIYLYRERKNMRVR